MYRFLSAAFLEPPSKTLIGTLSGEGFIERLEQVFGAKALEELRRFIEEFDGDHESLAQEFHDLFTVPLGRYVTPYEAVYRDQRVVGDKLVQGLLMGPSTLAVKQLYQDAGAEVSEECKELPDHVGLELACMEYLCREEARALQQDGADCAQRARGLQKTLLREHLLEWVPALCSRVRENANSRFYRGIASLAVTFIERDDTAVAALAT